jgi:hypothetical protein
MNILAALARDPNVAPELRAVLAPQREQHRASAGWKRVFLSRNDADQYDRGYALWPHPMPREQALSTPFSAGFFDAEADAQVREDERRERIMNSCGDDQ